MHRENKSSVGVFRIREPVMLIRIFHQGLKHDSYNFGNLMETMIKPRLQKVATGSMISFLVIAMENIRIGCRRISTTWGAIQMRIIIALTLVVFIFTKA